MTIATAAWDAQQELYDQLRAAAPFVGPPPVPWSLGWPVGELPEEYGFVAMEVEEARRESILSGTAGPSLVNEDLTLRVVLVTTYSGSDPVLPRDRMKLLSDGVAEVLKADPFIGGSVARATLERTRIEEALTEERRTVAWTGWIDTNAWIV